MGQVPAPAAVVKPMAKDGARCFRKNTSLKLAPRWGIQPNDIPCWWGRGGFCPLPNSRTNRRSKTGEARSKVLKEKIIMNV